MTCFVNKLLIQQKYPGHSFRRSSATFLANTGATIEDIKRHTGHKSTDIAYKYIGESKGHKIKTGNAIAASLSASSVVAGNDSMRVLPSMDGHDTHIIGNIDKCGASASSAIASNGPFQSFEQWDGVTESIASSGDDNEVQASQVSVNHQNVLARMGKNLSFRNCEKIIINFK